MFSSTTSYGLPRSKSITPDEMARIITRAKDHDPELYVFCALGTGLALRMCETLHVSSSDLIDGQLQITRRKKKVLKPELVEVPPALYAVLSEWSQMFEDWIFPGDCGPCVIKHLKGGQTQVCQGGHLSKRAIQRRWELNLARCGLSMEGRGVHSMRHYGITAVYAATKNLRATQLFAGHSSSSMTERYAKVLEMRELIHKLPVVL